jgi:hypothetical protein
VCADAEQRQKPPKRLFAFLAPNDRGQQPPRTCSCSVGATCSAHYRPPSSLSRVACRDTKSCGVCSCKSQSCPNYTPSPAPRAMIRPGRRVAFFGFAMKQPCDGAMCRRITAHSSRHFGFALRPGCGSSPDRRLVAPQRSASTRYSRFRSRQFGQKTRRGNREEKPRRPHCKRVGHKPVLCPTPHVSLLATQH